MFGGEGKPLAYVCGKLEQSNTRGPAGRHYQGWCQFKKRIRLTAICKMFPSVAYHWSPCAGTEEHNEKYCKKTRTQVGEFEFFGEFQIQGASKVTAIDVIEKMVRGGCSKYDLWNSKEAGVFKLMSTRHRGVYEAMAVLNKQHSQTAEFTLDQFGWTPIVWGRQVPPPAVGPASYTWVLAGPSGIGKTEFALAHFKNALVVTRVDDLKRFDPATNDGILFDDCDEWLRKLSRTEQIQLAEQVGGRSIGGRHYDSFIPGSTKKVWTTNDVEGAIFTPDPAIDRRHKIRVLQAVQHPVGCAVVPNVQASSSSREPGDLEDDDFPEDPLDDEEQPGVLVRADAQAHFDVPPAEELEGWSQHSSTD